MSRVGRPSKNDLIYNEDLKKRFIEEKYTNIKTKQRYLKVFKRTYEYEDDLQKDVFNFNLDEITDMMTYFSRTSPTTINSELSILNKYISWAIEQNLTGSIINVIQQYLDKKVKSNMVSKVAQVFKYLRSEEDLINIINSCVNAQDAVCFVLPYHGFKAEDILNLKIDHIKGNDIFLDYDLYRDVVDEDGRKVIDEETGKAKREFIKHVNKHFYIKDVFMEVIHEAYNQTVYTKNNGVFIKSGIRSQEVNLEHNSRYIIHGTVNKGRGNSITLQVINNRIKRVVESFALKGEENLNTKLLTLVNVFYSGMFIKLHELEHQRPLTPQDYMDMREQYGIDARNWNDLEDRYQSWKKNS